jgi:ATP-binding cassette subfamily A (ABC1) protein 3
MSHGKLECMGSPMFLKRLYGCGYLLSFVIQQRRSGVESHRIESPATPDRPGRLNSAETPMTPPRHGREDRQLLGFIRSKLRSSQSAKISSFIGREVVVEINSNDAGFIDLMEALDDEKIRDSIGIASFGISVPNIEEVFLKVTNSGAGSPTVTDGQSGEPSEMDRINSAPSSAEFAINNYSQEKSPTKKISATFTQQFTALLERRIRYSVRDRYFFVMQLLFPFIILIVGLGFVKAGTNQTPTPIRLNSDFLNSGANENFWQSISTDPNIGIISSYCATGNTSSSSSPTACSYLVPPYGNISNPYEFQTSLLHPNGWPYKPNPFFAYGTFIEPNSSNPLHGVWQNTTGIHTAALGVLGYFNAWASKAGQVELSIVNDPLPNTIWELQANDSITGLLSVQIILLALRFIPTAVISFIILEKEREIKEQLYISGVSVKAYWLSHFVFDSLFSVLSSLVAIVCFFIYNLQIYIGGENLAGSFALLLVYGPASCAFAYACSFLFSTQHTGQSFIAVSSLILGNILMVLAYVLMLLPTDTCASCYNIGESVLWVGRLFPPFALGSGFYVLASYIDQFKISLTSSKIFGGCKFGFYFTRFDCYAGIGDDLFFLGLMTFVYMGIAIFVDWLKSIPRFQKRFVVKSSVPALDNTSLEDEDVLREKARVDALDPKDDMLLVRRIQKVFRRAGMSRKAFFGWLFNKPDQVESTTVHAVESVSFAADKGQVFGLLGSNGAGKTTTFKMLCGLYCPSNGEIFVNGMNATDEMIKVRRIIGYCAQFDAQWDLLTTREHVLLYAKLRGYKGAELRKIVESKMDELNLREYEFVRSAALSGGNKRKLSVAMALVGEPELVFLDEPSCGMDPFARRNMWKIIESVADKRKHAVIILTTHSMEEAEALCSRIAIQVDGRFRCLGSSQEIKSRYGDGFQLNIRVVPGQSVTTTVDSIRKEIATSLGIENHLDTCVSLEKWNSCPMVTGVSGRLERFNHTSFGLKETTDDSTVVSIAELAAWVFKDTLFGNVQSFLMSLYSKVELVELHGLNIVVKISGQVKIGSLFKKLNENKTKLGIQDYQVTQTTLEQIFNRFAATAANKED